MDKYILIIIWAIFFLMIRKRIKSGIVYFSFLACMCLPVALNTNRVIMKSWYCELNEWYMIAFSLCLVAGFLPWLRFDGWVRNKIFSVKESTIKKLEVLFLIFSIASLCAILYLLPYAIKSLGEGASEVRQSLKNESPLPSSIVTTFAVTIASCCMLFGVLFFYLACLSPRFKKFRVWLVISSFTYVVSCFAITARDGLIILPAFYIVFYIIFKNSLTHQMQKLIRKRLVLVICASFLFLLSFSLSRFFDKDEDMNILYQGTVGYISQQPYVFNTTVEKQNDFWGFEKSFPLVNRILGNKEYKVKINRDFEWSFGTMYSQFYSSFGWSGLIGIALSFVIFYTFGIYYLCKYRKSFGLLLFFSVYLFLAITGMFYYRAGGKINMNIFFIVISLIPFFVPNIITVRTKSIEAI